MTDDVSTDRTPAIVAELQDCLYLGNLNAVRDWGHARDFVRGMWLILQRDEPDDYVLASGEAHTVREFVEAAFREVDKTIEWYGAGLDEQGVDSRTGHVLVKIDPQYRRPTEVDALVGDPSKARQRLGWRHRISFSELVKEMVEEDLRNVANERQRQNRYE